MERGFTAALVGFGGGALEGVFAHAFAVFAEDPADVQCKVFAIFGFHALWGRHKRTTDVVLDYIGEFTAAFVTASSAANECIFADTFSVGAFDPGRVLGEAEAVGVELAFARGAAGRRNAEVVEDNVGGFTAAFVVFGGGAFEGVFAHAFAVVAEDPVEV